MYYYFNPNYKLIEDKEKVVILSKNIWTQEVPDIPCEMQFQTEMHPVYAAFLSFFCGNSLENTLENISKHFDISVESIEKSIKSVIDNEDRKYIKFGKDSIIFPKHTIISSKNAIPNYKAYNADEFLKIENIDLSQKRTNKPLDLTLMINNKCYTNCIYCYEDRRNKINCEISFERISEIIEEAHSLNMRGFDLIGGEVFLYENWKELLSLLLKYEFCPFVSTKLPLSDPDIEFLKTIKLRELQFSLDAYSDVKFEKLLRVDGSKYKKKITQTFAAFDKYSLNVSVHTILSKENCNVNDLNDLYIFLKKHNILKWKIDYVQNSYHLEGDFNDIKVSTVDVITTYNYLMELKSTEKSFEIECSDIIARKQNGIRKEKEDFLHNKSQSCPANSSSFFILPDGNVTICEQLYWNEEYIIGNVKKESLVSVWNSEKALSLYKRRQYITNIQSPCSGCPDSDYCSKNNLVCYRDVVAAYGQDKWDFPDPKCHRAPEPLVELQ